MRNFTPLKLDSWPLLCLATIAVMTISCVEATATSDPVNSLLQNRDEAARAFSPAGSTAVFPYTISNSGSASVESSGTWNTIRAKDNFNLVLIPTTGGEWNMEAVSILGVMLKNTGTSELVLDTMLCNDGATNWSNSSLGRTIVKAGEEVPLGSVICRTADYAGTHPAYLRMSGKPDGAFRHWHTINPKSVKMLIIKGVSPGEHSFALGPMVALKEMDDSKLGQFPFIDTFGQYMLKDWPGKVSSEADLVAGIALEKKLAADLGPPAEYSKYGGWKKGPKFEATGFFRTTQHDGRWWFVDPEGYLFWSYGVTCVGVEYAGQTPLVRDLAVFETLPSTLDKDFGQFFTKLDVEDNYKMLEDVPHYDFTRANLFRKYGEDWQEKQVCQDMKRMKYCGLNTIGAWSDNAVAERKEIPYTVMLHYQYGFAAEKLPDPFDPETREGLRKAIHEYPIDFKNDSWCLGAFVNNELHWHNDAKQMIAGIFSFEEEATEAKKVFRAHLKDKYATIEALNAAWKTSFAAWDDLLGARDKAQLKHINTADANDLAFLFADAFFKMVDEELHAYSPNILYMGSRMNSASSPVLKAAAQYVDVISANIYAFSANSGNFGNSGKPVLISEFHFVNVLGSGLGSGLRSALDSVQQGRLFKTFIEDAVNNPEIIGAHWFQWRDQNAAGRYDGENYDVGFFDVADMPNEALIRAAAETAQNLYNAGR